MRRKLFVSVCHECGKVVQGYGEEYDLPEGWLHTQQGKFCETCKEGAGR